MERGKSKNVIYYHIKKQFGKKYKPLIFKVKSEEKFGEFLGAFMGDGGFYFGKNYKYSLVFFLSLKEIEYAKYLSDIINEIFGKKPNIWIDKKRKIIRITLMGKEIYDVLKKYLYWSENKTHSICLKDSLLNSKKDFLKGIIRGLIATDGSVYIPKNRISFGTVSLKLCNQFSKILEKFKIKHYIYTVEYRRKKTLYHVHITDRNNLADFNRKIGITEQFRKSQLQTILNERL